MMTMKFLRFSELKRAACGEHQCDHLMKATNTRRTEPDAVRIVLLICNLRTYFIFDWLKCGFERKWNQSVYCVCVCEIQWCVIRNSLFNGPFRRLTNRTTYQITHWKRTDDNTQSSVSQSPAYAGQWSIIKSSLQSHHALLHLPFFSLRWNLRSRRVQMSLHWMTRLFLSASSPGRSGLMAPSVVPRMRKRLPMCIRGHLQARSFMLTHSTWSPLFSGSPRLLYTDTRLTANLAQSPTVSMSNTLTWTAVNTHENGTPDMINNKFNFALNQMLLK